MSEEYLTIEELSARLKIKPKTVKNKMAAGIFRKGVHFFSPPTRPVEGKPKPSREAPTPLVVLCTCGTSGKCFAH